MRIRFLGLGVRQVLIAILALQHLEIFGALLFPHTIPINMRIKISLYIFIQHFHLLPTRVYIFSWAFPHFPPSQHRTLRIMWKFTFNLPIFLLCFCAVKFLCRFYWVLWCGYHVHKILLKLDYFINAHLSAHTM